MSMLSARSPQRVHGKGKRVVERSSYHCHKYSTDFKRTKIEAGNLQRTGLEISRNSKVDSNVVVQGETSRIIGLNDSTSEHRMPHGKAKDLHQKLTEKNVKLVGNKAKSDKVTAREAVHASDKSKTLSHPMPLARSDSLSKTRQGVSVLRDLPQGFVGLDHPSNKSGVLTNRLSQLEQKSLDGALKISDKQDFSSSGRKLDKSDSTDITARDPNKLKQVSRDETSKVAQRKTSLEYRRKLKDDEDSSPKGQNGDRAKNFSEKTRGDPEYCCIDTFARVENNKMFVSRKVSCSFNSSFEDHAMAKHQGKSVPEPTEAQPKRKESALITEFAGSGVPKLNMALDVSLTPQSTNFSSVSSNECQEVGGRDKVLKALKQFKELYTQLLEEWKREPKGQREGTYRADLKAATILKENGKWINSYPHIGNVPGIQIGDCFQFRAELAVIGLHREYVCGIHYEKIGGVDYATSIVDSGRYHNRAISADEFIYMGEGGNPDTASSKTLKDQTLDGGNLALKNSMDSELPVRVIRRRQTLGEANTMGINTGSRFAFFYDGLYKTTDCQYDRDPESGKNVFEFRMKRMTADPNLSHQISCGPRKSTIQRKHVMIDDALCQKEKMPISAVKDVKTSKFTYSSKPNGCGYKTAYSHARHSSFPLRIKEEIFDHEAAAPLAKPVISNRGTYSKQAMAMLKLS